MNIHTLFASLILSLLLSSCVADYDDNEDYTVPERPLMVNAPFPEGADTLRVLAIGNSFTENATSYLRALTDSSAIDPDRLGIYILTYAGARFSHWNEAISTGEQVRATRITGIVPMLSQGTVSELIAQPWDVIVIQQASDVSYKWKTFSTLDEYIPRIKSLCPNPDLCLAYQMPWSHTPDEMPYVMKWNINCTRRMTETYGIDVILPIGTAIQLARSTRLNDSRYLTSDNWHLNAGMGQYIASCCWFEGIIARCFGISIIHTTAMPQGNYTSDEAALGRECARRALIEPYDY